MTDEDKKKRSIANIKYWDSHRKPILQKNGYLTLCIGNKRQYVHRMVMEEHIGRPLEKYEHVHHINGDRTDNRLENLQLINRSEHLRKHALEHHLGCETGRSPINKTKESVIKQIKEMRSSGAYLKDICNATGLSYPTVQKYAKGANA